MNVFDRDDILKRLHRQIETPNLSFKKYVHLGICKTGPCQFNFGASNTEDMCCEPYIDKIHASNRLHHLPKHPNCDCGYIDIDSLPAGSISKRQPSPDVWLKAHGKLPDYYITKEEAEKIYGWKPGRNTMKGKAPGKMIGGDVYNNDQHVLPEEDGRVWFECDIDYTEGSRSSARLYYSNDGLMFYSPNHLAKPIIVYFIN